MAFGLVIGFINHIQVVTTINYYTIAALQITVQGQDFMAHPLHTHAHAHAYAHNLQSLHTNLFSLSTLVFTDL
jgi:hypothetical protein